MVSRWSGAVRMPLSVYKQFIERMPEPSQVGVVDAVTTTLNRHVVLDQITYSTVCGSLHNEVFVAGYTATRWDRASKGADDEDPTVAVLIGLETSQDKTSMIDVVTAAGLELESVRDLLTGVPVRTRAPADFPNYWWEVRVGINNWLTSRVPSLVVLVRTAKGKTGETAKLGERAIPWPMRSAVPLLGVSDAIAETFNELLAEHGIAPLQPESVTVLRRSPSELLDWHRLKASQGKAGARRLFDAVVGGLEAVSGDVREYLVQSALDDFEVQLHDHSDTLEQTVAQQQREISRLSETAARSEASLVQARREKREAEYQVIQLRREYDPQAGTSTKRTSSEREDGAGSTQEGALEDMLEELEAPPESVPQVPRFDSFAELLSAARDRFDLVVVGDVDDTAAALDQHAKAPVWRARTWSALVTLQRYAASRNEGTAVGLKPWLEAHPEPLLSPDAIATGETAATAQQPEYRRARTFAVPYDVSASGVAYFAAHIRIESGRTSPAPRMHYLDDCARTGKIYIGYLGKHLPSRRGD